MYMYIYIHVLFAAPNDAALDVCVRNTSANTLLRIPDVTAPRPQSSGVLLDGRTARQGVRKRCS